MASALQGQTRLIIKLFAFESSVTAFGEAQRPSVTEVPGSCDCPRSVKWLIRRIPSKPDFLDPINRRRIQQGKVKLALNRG
jgi:hypothetical protein